ncbi:MAG: Smr/MutS family protein [Candidatus Brocadiae bacterium]|nr:Smr/MutS family protein [Candidatus Brocadiia bacterium]
MTKARVSVSIGGVCRRRERISAAAALRTLEEPRVLEAVKARLAQGNLSAYERVQCYRALGELALPEAQQLAEREREAAPPDSLVQFFAEDALLRSLLAAEFSQPAWTRYQRRRKEAPQVELRVLHAALSELAQPGAMDRTLAELRSRAVEPREARKRLDQVHRGMAEKAQALERPGTPLAPGEIRPGLAVRVRSLGQDGIVTAIRGKGGRAAVNCSGMDVEVAFEDLVRGESPPPVPAARREPKPPVAGPREIDLRGLRVEEALRLLAGEIDDCLMAGSPSVRIIHGFGTGALSQACTEWLRRHPQVEGFRHGKPEEGGGGVTVASFRA